MHASARPAPRRANNGPACIELTYLKRHCCSTARGARSSSIFSTRLRDATHPPCLPRKGLKYLLRRNAPPRWCVLVSHNLQVRSSGAHLPRILLVGPYDPHCGEYTFLAPPLGVWRLAGVLG